jgi:plasmid stabilization system protein ParE
VKPLFSVRAARQIDEIYVFIAREDLRAAQKVVDRIYEAARFVTEYPKAGHATKREGLRAIPAGSYPYVLYFRWSARDRQVRILRILHTARRRPELQDEAQEFRLSATS